MENLSFAIITPTYQRPKKLARAIASVHAQSYKRWNLIIINDSPDDLSYQKQAEIRNDPRITYLINEQNSGVNFSRNRGLDHIPEETTHVIFLDDDDYLAQDALEHMARIIREHKNVAWIMTNRVYENGIPITHAPRDKHYYSYARDYLIFRRIKGDATHCVQKKALKDIFFPKHIRQAEEWLFYFTLDLVTKPYYESIATTYSGGYEAMGLNLRTRNTTEQLKTLTLIIREGSERNLVFSLSFWFYCLMRLMRAFIK